MVTSDETLTSDVVVTSEVPRRSVVSEETVEETRVTAAVSDSGSLLIEDEDAVENSRCSDVIPASVLS